ncbi:zinc finger A20 and AN1 domain-containing stress-associated protein 8 isoform X1 [Capsicum annuum]|nr:zinc finger A20 and AN1 domain-containing stress-associated protein 8 isoform X1 [Capsicum annuum]
MHLISTYSPLATKENGREEKRRGEQNNGIFRNFILQKHNLSLFLSVSLSDLNLLCGQFLKSFSSYSYQNSFCCVCGSVDYLKNFGCVDNMEHDDTGCQPPPEGPILCINNCGFFGSAANMNMCSKCYKDMVLKQEQAKLAVSSIGNLVNGSSSSEKGMIVVGPVDVQPDSIEAKSIALPSSQTSSSSDVAEVKAKVGPNRCGTCKKKVGITGFKCRCCNLYCGAHRYSDKHDCQFDYRLAAQNAIAKANPVVKAEKLDKI